MHHFKIIFLIFVASFISCAEERTDNPPPTDGAYIAHPIPSKMPHPDFESIEIKAQPIEEAGYLSSLPESLRLLYNFLNEDSLEHEQQTIDMLTTRKIEIAFLNKSNLLVLDERDDKIWQYNLKSNKNTEVSGWGKGPGDLIFSKGLAVYNDKALVSMQGYKISFFNCSTGVCEYKKTIKTDFNNYSISAGENFFYVLAIPPFGRDQDSDPTNTSQFTIHKFDYTGKLEKSFLPVYQHRAPLVRDRMVAGGSINYYPNKSIVTSTFKFYKNVYIYSNKGKLKKKYIITDLKQPYYGYKENSERPSGTVMYNDNSSILHSSKIGERWLLLTIKEQRNVEFIDLRRGFKGDEWYAYYAFDINNSTLYKIGRDKKTHKPSEVEPVYTTEYGLFVYKDSTLRFYKI